MKILKCDRCEGMIQVEEKDIIKNRYALDTGDEIKDYVLCKECFKELQEIHKKATKDFLETKIERNIACSCCGNKIALENATYDTRVYRSPLDMKIKETKYIICPVCGNRTLIEEEVV